jgi:hypothetical protein
MYRTAYDEVMGRRSGIIAVPLVCLVGCGVGDPQRTSEPAAPSKSATQGPSASPPRSTSTSPTVALADVLPRSLNGVELHTFATGGDIIDRLASTLGVAPSAIEAAYASEHGARFFQTYALRVRGVGGTRLREAFIGSAYDRGDGDVTRDEATIGGRSVTVVMQPTTAARLGTFYAYLHDGVLIVVQAIDPAVADEVIGAMP